MRLLLTLSLILVLAAALAAAEKPVVGSWQCVSDSPDGEQYRWTVTVKETDGKLSGIISGAPGEYPMVDPQFDNGVFTFKVQIEGQTYTIEAKISGDKLDGVWKGATSQGVIKGTKQS
jgi:hypothetical protein